MKKLLIFICLLVAAMAVTTSCSNSAKAKYESQKAYVDSLQKVNRQNINGAMLTETGTAILTTKLQCYHQETLALDSLKNLAKEAFGDNSAEYKEAYDRYVKAKETEEETTNQSIRHLRDATRGL